MAFSYTYVGPTLETGSGGGPPGNTPVTADTLDTDGDTMYVYDADDNGIDDVLVRAYVSSEWSDNPLTAPIRDETRTIADGSWDTPLMLDAGVLYRIILSKSGYTFESTTVTP